MKISNKKEKEGRTCALLEEHTARHSQFLTKGTLATFRYLSARTSKGLVPRDQLRTIQAESIAARKPRAIPVPIGQKGYQGDIKQN